jgi:hypothetical protein
LTFKFGLDEGSVKLAKRSGRQSGASAPEDLSAKRLGIGIRGGKLVWSGPEIDIPITRGFLVELLLWVPYIATVLWMRTIRSFDAAPRPSIHFWPASPGPWYMIVGAAAWGGVRIDASPQVHSHNVYFEDVTRAQLKPEVPLNAINGRCTDIRKSYVAAIFEAIFGYPLALDPTSYHGPMVEKPETNGTHGGRVLRGPVLPVSGSVYQKLIDTADDNNQCNDLRTPCIGGRPVFVWRKRKQADKRFGIHNDSATLHNVDEIFSAHEVTQIIAFNAAMGLECGGLDILRDQADGRIYIVDVNKTDVGPLIALKWPVKMASMALLGQALRAWLIERRAAGTDSVR